MGLVLQLILVAIVLAVIAVYLKVKKVLKPPPELEHLPNYLVSWKMTKEFFFDKLTLPERRKRYPETCNVPLCKAFFFGAWEVVVADPEYAREIYTNQELYPKILFSEIYPELLSSKFFGINLAFSNGDVWRRHHKVIAPAFQTKNLIKIATKVFPMCVDLLYKEWEKVDSKPIAVHEWAQRFTLDALGHAGFSFDLGSIKNPDAKYVKVYNNIIRSMFNPLLLVFPWVSKLPIPMVKRVINDINLFDTFLLDIVDVRKKQKMESSPDANKEDSAVDLLDLMLCSSDLSVTEIRNNLVLFFIAGHDTTATSIAVTAFFFAKYPDIQEKARKQVMEVFNSVDRQGVSPVDWIPSYDDQKNFEYLNACIKESLRVYPPAGALPARTATSDVKLGNTTIRKGTQISINIFDLHRNSAVWGPDSDDYIPERFLDESHPLAALDGVRLKKQPTRNDHPMAFNAFGASLRSCIGQQFSLIEQRIFLSTLLLRYDLSLPAGVEDIVMGPTALLCPKGLYINLKRRF